MGEWKEMKFNEMVEINPSISLSKSKEHFYIEMQDMDPSRRYVHPKRKRPLQGGSRFAEGDTLFARISPCTEKGNINQAAGLEGAFGYGSTEFLVFRAKPGVSDQDFILYFSKWNEIKDYAANNLQGTSGRQRVAKEAFDELDVVVPSFSEQRSIASVLSSLDAKIDLLHRQNKTLEGMAEALFREWFVDREGRGLGEGDGQGWEEGTLSSLGPIEMGNSPKGDSYNEVGEGVPLINGPVEYGDYFPLRSKWTTDPKRFAEAGDLIFCVRGSTTGRRVVADGRYAIGRGVCAFRSEQRMFLYQTIEAKLPDLLAQTTGSVFPSLSSEDIKNFPITLPPQKLRDRYEALAGPMLERIEANHRQCATLAALRDRLLPKLMSGEVRVEVK